MVYPASLLMTRRPFRHNRELLVQAQKSGGHQLVVGHWDCSAVLCGLLRLVDSPSVCEMQEMPRQAEEKGCDLQLFAPRMPQVRRHRARASAGSQVVQDGREVRATRLCSDHAYPRTHLVRHAGRRRSQLILGRSAKGIDWAVALVAGLVGSFVGGLLISLLSGDGLQFRPSGIIGSLVGALLVTAGWQWYRRRNKASHA